MDQALAYYLKGETYYLYFDKAANQEARRLYGEAAKLDAGFVRAHADLAYAMLHAWLFGWDDNITLADIKQQAIAARDIDVNHYYGHWILADVLLHDHDVAGATAEFNEADALAAAQAIPEDLRAMQVDRADMKLLTGYAAEAAAEAADAIQNSPVPEKWFYWVLGWAHYVNGDHHASLKALFALHNPRNAIRKNVVCNYVALAEGEKDSGKKQEYLGQAKWHAAKFLEEEKAQGVTYAEPGQSVLPRLQEIEQRVPFSQPSVASGWWDHIVAGFDGVPQP